ncbi:hypothetical protein BMS3Bbin06_00955 [bacterium BMS3Bbin06]|nr:hypothetical protein BMS3Abin08_01554 [bacterium BMS3Abin08]GBE34432.1 hypothetical protein BMS3Bbin06_00955 [bacterium BMS3Bbin06]HDO35770.1 cytosolic protein [Nitrospirota bacterium]HDY70117.1 cytosolic protein [Nitrospirota bacterium]
MECISKVNLQKCNCSYASCSRRGKCCECLHYHRRLGELPACVFHEDYERSYDRSVENFIRMVGSMGMRTS